eukprot:CAMPEP_0176498574 /NCGR_PEP_ID=MMETSP0200_2-20121128/12399_1 /TAXON_ID=947934 /ORGANISM="Chaetoceros sp., Strain GSL56" /LENGTH=465 /DNA_ID=CAMNT_0017896801 /DNA_START=36 /DNA_END=1433 /DNA_ORIENTATION=+
MSGHLLSSIPFLPPCYLLTQLLLENNPLQVIAYWIHDFIQKHLQIEKESSSDSIASSQQQQSFDLLVGPQLLAYVIVSIFGYWATDYLIPAIKSYTLQKGICGKDLGKRGTKIADNDIPEALGIVPGAIFLICLTFCLVGYATSHPTKQLDLNSALLSVCFMLFLGFTDDVLDWPWRYKLVLPTVASLPLLCCYSGSTSIVVPIQLRSWLMQNGELTTFGRILCYFVVVDENANGSILNLGLWYLLYMGMLAVFCTNAINIYAGINGLEAGQAYVIGCAVLFHNLLEIQSGSDAKENHLFSAMIMLSFIGVTLGLLKHNWYPASVFVGDTFCYFAGMTFAVVGILGHFSKTLLLFFIPQVINFLYSTPQLFKLVPCPRHRLPKFNPHTGLMEPSTFECRSDQYTWLKRNINDTTVPNMTLINLMLQYLGPMNEKSLCIVLLGLQMMFCALGLLIRYKISSVFFDA